MAAFAGAPASTPSCPSAAAASDSSSGAAASPKSEAAKALEWSNALLERGEYSTALAAYEETQRLARESGDAALATLAAANAARAAVESAQFDVAAAKLEEALGARESLTDPSARAQLLIHIARTYALLGERDATRRRSAIPRADETLQAALEVADAAGAARLRSYALGYRGELYEQQGRSAEAVALTRRAIQVAELADAPDALYRWQWQLGRLEVAAGHSESALRAYRETAATLRDIRAQTALSADAVGSFNSGSRRSTPTSSICCSRGPPRARMPTRNRPC